jgi:hypothetical protein
MYPQIELLANVPDSSAAGYTMSHSAWKLIPDI